MVKESGMKKSMTALVAAMVVVSALPALAGGAVVMAPEPAPIVAPAPVRTMPANGDWTGLSVGLSLTYAMDTYRGFDGSGGLYGARLGYDYDFGQFVMGAIATYDIGEIGVGGGRLNQLSRIGLRAGVDLGANYLYATGGPAWATQEIAGEDQMDNGWFAGIGAEHRLMGNWTIGGELLTNRFADFADTGNDFESTTLGMNVNYRF